MSNDVIANVGQNLTDIGFPEFTTKLVSDVFDSLIASNLRQTEAYVELLKQTSKSLTDFVNDTKDDIDGDMILEFLNTVVGVDKDGQTIVRKGATLTNEQATSLNNALEVKDGELPNNNQIDKPTEQLKDAKYNAVLEAVAKRISADKYTLLQEMVKQGMLRLVVNEGEIETRLTFNTYSTSISKSKSSDYQRSNFDVKAKAKTGGLLSGWVKASASTSYNRVRVSTATKSDVDRSSTSANIYGRVYLNFKTDYQPLNQD